MQTLAKGSGKDKHANFICLFSSSPCWSSHRKCPKEDIGKGTTDASTQTSLPVTEEGKGLKVKVKMFSTYATSGQLRASPGTFDGTTGKYIISTRISVQNKPGATGGHLVITPLWREERRAKRWKQIPDDAI